MKYSDFAFLLYIFTDCAFLAENNIQKHLQVTKMAGVFSRFSTKIIYIKGRVFDNYLYFHASTA